MLTVTKIFSFEMAHAIHGYMGACKNIHGHSYELHVGISAGNGRDGYIPSPGFMIDFREIKKWVNTTVIEGLDHKLLLSRHFLEKHPELSSHENLVTWDTEPTAENILFYIKEKLSTKISPLLELAKLKLYETKDSYAEWTNG